LNTINYIKTATRETPLGLFQFGNNEKSLVVDGQFKSVSASLDCPWPAIESGMFKSFNALTDLN
jgi:HAE1 family hydrophobic/amphiphilic exporter-1